MTKLQVCAVLVFVGVVLLAVAVLVAYDLFLDWTYGTDATISKSMEVLGREYPFFPWAIGLCMGLLIGALAAHFWWPTTQPRGTPARVVLPLRPVCPHDQTSSCTGKPRT